MFARSYHSNLACWAIKDEGKNQEHWHQIPKGAKNGLQNGLKLVLDVESFDYAYFIRGAKGFRVAIASALDQAVVNQGPML